MDAYEKYNFLAAQIRQKLRILLFFRYFLAWGAGVLFVWGVVILVQKALSGQMSSWVYWLGTGMGVPIGAAIIGIKRHLPSRTAIKSFLDEKMAAGGLITASDEVDVQVWKDHLPEPQFPTIHWQGYRRTGAFLAAVLFFTGVLWAPMDWVSAQAHPVDISQDVEHLNEQLMVLEEEKVVEPDQIQQYRQDVVEMEVKAQKGEGDGLWEAIDHLDAMFKETSQLKAADLLDQMRKIALAQQLTQALRDHLDQIPADMNQLAQQTLAKMGGQQCQRSGDGNGNDTTRDRMQELIEKMRGGQASGADLKKFQELLKNANQSHADRIARMIDAKLLSRAMGEKSQKAGQCNNQELADYLLEQEGDLEGLGRQLCEQPGRGGISRGRGDAALTWKNPTSTEGMAFQEEILPPGQMADLSNSHVVGVSLGDPQSDEPLKPSGHGALATARAAGGSAFRQVVYPVHRKAVDQYFKRDSGQDQSGQ